MADYDLSLVGSALEFDIALYADGSVLWIDATHFILAHQGASQDGFLRVMTIDGSGAISQVGTELEFDIVQGMDNCLYAVDATHFLNIWRGALGDGFAQVFSVNTSTWALTQHGTALEFDIGNLITPAVAQVDSTHYLVAWGGVQDDGFAQILTVNTSTWAVTAEGTMFEHDTARGEFNDLFQIDATHYFLGYTGVGNQAFAKVLEVNTSTWAVTQPASSVQLSSAGGQDSGALQIDSTHYLLTWTNTGTPYDVLAQVVTVNTSTWAITTNGTAVTVGQGILAGSLSHLAWVGDVAVIAWRDATSNGRARALAIDGSYNVTVVGTADLQFDSSGTLTDPVVTEVSASRGILIWSGTDVDGFIQAFDIVVPSGGTTPVSSDRSTTWDVAAAVTSDRSTTYDVAAIVQSDRSTTYDVATTVQSDRSTTYDVAAAVQSDRDTTWDVAAAVSSDRDTSWDVAAIITSDRNTTWDVLQAVTSDRSTTWDVASDSGLTSVSSDRSTTWDVAASVASDRDTTWDVAAIIQTDRTASYDVLVLVQADRDTSWDVLTSVVSDRDTTWDVWQAVTSDRVATWDTQSNLLPTYGVTATTGYLISSTAVASGAPATSTTSHVLATVTTDGTQ